MNSVFSYFRLSFVFSILGLILAFFVGRLMPEASGLKAVFLCAVLGLLEISLSFDNAVVNASVLGRMTPVWRHRFLTWGILIAVFGMRLVFPLLIVSYMGHLTPWGAIILAVTRPEDYSKMMTDAHVPIAAFGGAFLLMVSLRHFFDAEKDKFWLTWIEKPLSQMGRWPQSDLVIALITVSLISFAANAQLMSRTFLISALFGIATFIAVDGLGTFLGREGKSAEHLHRASLGLFVYLEILDASYSFDGVIGAFAITTDLFIIAIGLGIGALLVRSLTMLMVDQGTLKEFEYLEHGAFWAIFALAMIMFTGIFHEVPEVVSGFIGITFIALAFWSSLIERRRERRKKVGLNPPPPTKANL